MAITNIIRASDFEIEFQLEDQSSNIIDVDDILDIRVELINVKLHSLMSSYDMVDLTLNSADDTIHVYIEHSDNENKKLGKYLLKVWWEVADVNFSGSTFETYDQEIVANLIK
jgi:hypothetical protein